MRRLSLFTLIVITMFTVLGCSSDEPVTFELGMSKQATIDALKQLGAEDISGGMQVGGVKDEKGNWEAPKEWMWSLDDYALSIEVHFKDDKLVTLNAWNWQEVRMTSYHHTLEYSELNALKLDPKTMWHDMDVIKVHNAGQRGK